MTIYSKTYLKKHVNELETGDVLLHPIYRSDGLMLVNSFKELSLPLIKIVQKHIDGELPVLIAPSMVLFDELMKNKEYTSMNFVDILSDIIKEYNKKMAAQLSIRTFLSDEMMKSIQSSPLDLDTNKANLFFSKLFSTSPLWVNLENMLDSKRLKYRAIQVKQELLLFLESIDVFNKLFLEAKKYSDVLFIQSINSTCLSLLIGLTLELPTEDLIDLSIATIFSDIGYTEIPKHEFKEYLKNPEKHKQMLINHIRHFNNISSEYPELRKKSILYGILDHHEYFNGAGYPNGKKGTDISLFGRIILLSKTYDGLVGGYYYDESIQPREAIQIILENKDNYFDNRIAKIFLYKTTYYSVGEKIILPGNIKGTIIGFKDYVEYPYLPIVKFEDGSIIDFHL